MSTTQFLEPHRYRVGGTFESEGWREPLALLDPFVVVDHFRMSAPAFAPHPHAGFSPVTYVFDDSETAMVSRDSLGGLHTIAPGGLHWTVAGRGVIHDEFPAEPGRQVHGLQIFVNLPADQKLCAPAVMRLAPQEMPRRSGEGWRAVQVFGPEAGLALPSPASLVLADIDAGAGFDLSLPPGEQGFAIAIRGAGRVGGQPLAAGGGFALPLGASARVVADDDLRLACFCGRPLHEPVVRHGPFVMSDEGQVVAALHRFQSGAMGRLCPRQLQATQQQGTSS